MTRNSVKGYNKAMPSNTASPPRAFWRVLAAILLFAVAACSYPASAQLLPVPRVVGGTRLLTLDDIYGAHAIDLEESLPTIAGWMPDGARYILYDDNGKGEMQLLTVAVKDGKRAPLYDGPKMQAAFAAALGDQSGAAHDLAYRENYVVNKAFTKGVARYRNDLYLVRFADSSVTRLTNSPKEAKSEVGFSPDGSRVAFVREGTGLSVVAADEHAAADKPTEVALTHPEPGLQDGKLDWVYEEEVYDRTRGGHPGYVWSDDSRRVAFLRLDETPVRPYTIPNELSRTPEAETQKYPIAGDPNPIATVGIVDADGQAPPRFVDLKQYPAEDRLIVRLGWSPDSRRIVYEVQNRTQKFLDLNAADGATGQNPATLIHDTTAAWVDVIGLPVWLRDGGFLWLSDHSGHRQMYRCDANGGNLRATFPAGTATDIRTIYGVDAANRFAYVSTGLTPGVDGDAVCRVALDAPSPAEPVRLSLPGGTHHPHFDSTFHAYLDTWSDRATPPRIELYAADTGAQIALVAQDPGPQRAVAPFRRSVPERLTVRARDGFGLHALMIRPPDFDPTRHYPVFCPIYGGPELPNVTDGWMGQDELFYQLLAQQGYVVFLCDNRSANGSPADAWPILKRLGEPELRDIEDGVTFLKSQPWVDTSRIGISGWSYGGFMADYALTHSHSFKIGISGAGVSDWRLYDTIYTERYMDTPQASPDAYRATSPTAAAADCKGRLLLIHGMMDDNVHLTNTVELTYALERAEIPFDLMLYPGPASRHDIGDRRLNRHLQSVIYDFIKKNL